MDAWVVARPGPVATRPLERAGLPDPVPGPGELLIRVEVCAVCRTDLHLAEGDLPPRRPRTVPGHGVGQS
ncbi:alcohol dehydrogenase catalytic domain-containing protein, partial [Microbispora triticiradicis]|uniref:alcohol dehydrogenase catalytic domain-containing protein n=1 Tax=Microbispora triticiradicis TaxID=2200763 RepID=UPI001AD76B29